MIEIKGKYETAIVQIPSGIAIESSAYDLIKNYVDQPYSRETHPVIMPDVHTGVDCVIGFTAEVKDGIRPGLIGVDIGCGVLSTHFHGHVGDFSVIDSIIRGEVPLGFAVNEKSNKVDEVLEVCDKMGMGHDRANKSLGTLGGGNHFIELGEGKKGDYWLTVHTGSRNFGNLVAKHHMKIASEKTTDGVLRDDLMQDYSNDMAVAQEYASWNRMLIKDKILGALNWWELENVESVHNYYDFTDNTIRKGAISANKGQRVVIPMNMAEGTIIGIGLGNSEYNNSAPHGSGRNMSRTKARKTYSMEEFEASMEGVWSSCVDKARLDESPMAYKDSGIVKSILGESVEIIDILKPIYNLKG